MKPVIATFLSWVLLASAQQTAPPAQPAQPDLPKGVKFSAGTQLVVEDIIIKDKSGNPITGLKASDFVVLEDGKPQKIDFVEFQKLEDTTVPVVEAPKPKVEEAKPAPAATPA